VFSNLRLEVCVDSKLTAFLLLVSGNLIRLEAGNGALALAVVVGVAISPSAVAVARAPPHVAAQNGLVVYVLAAGLPKGIEGNPVLPRDGSGGGRPAALRRQKSYMRAPVHQTQHHRPPPHACGRGGTTRGSSAIQPPVVFRPYPPWVVGAGSGRVITGPKFAAGTAASAADGFLCHREGQKSVGFYPMGGAHQSAWSLYIVLGHTPRRRRPAGA
jgi:hypothetical protein